MKKELEVPSRISERKKRVIDIICDVASEELKIPRKKISGKTGIPASTAGMMVAMRMANAIPGGGGMLSIEPTGNILCTVDNLAEKCTEEMVRLRDSLCSSK